MPTASQTFTAEMYKAGTLPDSLVHLCCEGVTQSGDQHACP